ncbi:hypothetical protein CC86DRAFT_471533 [Ophiobolus disseminans]|uniref:C2H2-type domain-containing protein n=1 Tax=Ophiobolus disseminans TaxID=1469910 RepID=A0A6A6ZIA6_9PLEO|nr:hypothetical protein CC86DRAFT_471533 [Ophiobolus disseminans]
MTTPGPDDLGEAPTTAPPPAPPPTANQTREAVQASNRLKELVKSCGLNEGAVRAFASLDEPEDVHKLQGMVESVPDEIKKLHSYLKEYGVDNWLQDNYPKGTRATRNRKASGSSEAAQRVNMPADAGCPIDKLPPTPQPHQASLQPSSSSRGPHGGTTASASRSQSAEATRPASAPASQGAPPKRKRKKRLNPATQGEPQKEFHCPICHKKYEKLGWFESHFEQHIQVWFGAESRDHLFGCGYCVSPLSGSLGGDLYTATAFQGCSAIAAHVRHKHSKYQENKADWLDDAAIRSVLWHDKFSSIWLQFLANSTGTSTALSTYLSWNALKRKDANRQLLSDLQKAGASLPGYVPGQPYPDSVRELMQRAYKLADQYTQPPNPAYSGEPGTVPQFSDLGSLISGMGDQAGNLGWDPMPLPGTTLDGPPGSHMGFGQNPFPHNHPPPDITE